MINDDNNMHKGYDIVSFLVLHYFFFSISHGALQTKTYYKPINVLKEDITKKQLTKIQWIQLVYNI